MNKNARIYVAGHRGLVGSAIIRRLETEGYTHLITRTHSELDLTDPHAVTHFFSVEKPEYVFLAAAKVGGILANQTYPAEFIHQNLMIQTNVIHSSYVHGIKKLLFLGSSCIYPKMAPQPIKEEYLMTGPLEPTNSAYAVAKIAGIEMCWAYNKQYGTHFIPVMPTNLYGPNDNYDLETAHVLPALIRKFHEAKTNNAESVTIWGTGKPKREFLHVDDMADACLHLITQTDMTNDNETLFNIGTGYEISIKDLGELIRNIVGYKGKIIFDNSKPNGTHRKIIDVTKIKKTGWSNKIKLSKGIVSTYRNYTQTQ
ncbi:GDP-L-fucose synthase family protein [Desulfoluna spongiiphila]|uniref:GDP-L-fucose synthase family protein n=1 Tax=Desulfoluna spongiiphila TaxID=419481 RepID=UPI00125940D8|nr:GDP-L-fucose synthase [Desulfoluna spongiiphila]VVS90867.1 gdp-l-fucose synthase/gdp-l-colitose synthase [Desulfoluna spongiiphila]